MAARRCQEGRSPNAGGELDDLQFGTGLDLKVWYLQNFRQIWILDSLALFLVIIFYGERHTTTIEDALSFCEVAVERLRAACWVTLIFTRRLRVHERYLVVAVLAMAYSASWLRNG